MKTKMISATVEVDTIEAIKEMAFREGRTFSAMVNILLRKVVLETEKATTKRITGK